MTKRELDTALRALAGALPPGSSLPAQRELCARFGVSTFTLHRSLRQLGREGLVTVIPRKGTFVREPPITRRVLRMAFLDKPDVLRIAEYGLSAFISVVGHHKMELRATHIEAGDRSALRDLLAMCEQESNCLGAVITGYVDDATAHFLESVDQPWILFGDVHSTRPWETLPIVTNHNFQGARLAAECLIERGCEHLILVNFVSEPDWSWVREARAGVFAALESHPEIGIILPQIPALSNSEQFLREVRRLLEGRSSDHIGVVFRAYYSLRLLEPLRQILPNGARISAAVFDVDVPSTWVPGICRITCSSESLAEAAIQRLHSIRRGADSPGRLRLPYQVVEERLPVLEAAS